MEQRRRYERYNVEILNINGRVSVSTIVIIKAITRHSLHLCADVRLNLGKEYNLKLESGIRSIIVRGVVESSALNLGMAGDGKGSRPLYCGEFAFKDVSAEGQEIIESLLQQYQKDEHSKLGKIVLSRDIPEEIAVGIVGDYRVKKISLGGMLVECGSELEIGSNHSFTLSLSEHTQLKIAGRVASCLSLDGEKTEKYDIGIAFSDIPPKERERVKEFIRLIENPDERLMDMWKQEKTREAQPKGFSEIK